MSNVFSDSNSVHIFKKEFISNSYHRNSADTLTINISTVIDVQLEDDTFSNGLYLIVDQNFRYRNSFGFFDPGSLVDTLFIANHTNRQFILNGSISYINASYYLAEPEVVIHDRNFSFYRP